MSSVIKIPDVVQVIRLAYRANRPILLEGRHGIGKSELFTQAAQIMGIDLVVLDLSLLEAVDLLGIPVVGDGVTRYATPALLPRDGKGILLLEELNRAQAQTRAPALELLTRRQLHEYTLPRGWLPAACINPSGGNYQVDEIDPALLSRFICIQVEADHAGWLRWARDNNVHPMIVAYAEAAPDIFTDSSVSPRSLTYASDLMKAHEASGNHNGKDALLGGLSGLVGDTLAVAIMRFVAAAEKPLEPKEIIENYTSVRPIALKLVQSGRLDLIKSTLTKLRRTLQRQATWDEVCESDAQSANVKGLLSDVPPDLRKEFEGWLEERGYTLPENG